MNWKPILLYVFVVVWFVHFSEQNVPVDLTLVLDEEITNQDYWKDLAKFFIENFLTNDTVFRENQIQVCVFSGRYVDQTIQILCGSVNREIFIDDLSQLKTHLKQKYERSENRTKFPHIVVGKF